MMCVKCDRLVRLGVYVKTGCPDRGMICWPCHLGEEEGRRGNFGVGQCAISALKLKAFGGHGGMQMEYETICALTASNLNGH